MCNTEQWMTAKQKGRWRVGRWRDMRALGLREREREVSCIQTEGAQAKWIINAI